MIAESIVTLAEEHAAVFRPGFSVWLRSNLYVWAAFEKEAHRVWQRGRRHYSARTIIEHLRHETSLSDSGIEFKLNNNSAPDLARLYRLKHPERAELFECRVMPGSARAAA